MTPEQTKAFSTAIAEMKTVSVAATQPHSADSLSDILQKQNIGSGSIDLANMTATGFSDVGISAIGDLARSFRPSLSANSKTASNATLGKFIAGQIITHWKTRTATSLAAADFDKLRQAVDDWFGAQSAIRRHVVPCTVFPYPTESFSIGPVTFCHVEQFPSEDFGVPRDVFWPRPLPPWKQLMRNVWAAVRAKPVDVQKPGGFKFEQFLEFAGSRHAPWMALIEVSGRAPDESARAADLAADVALASIQIVIPGDDMRQLARASGRAAPIWRVDVSQASPCELSTTSSSQMPALARTPQLISQHVKTARPLLESMGRRLEGFLLAASPLPELDSAWCNAAYWYHEALAETLDTVAVAKLETAIEVLFRAENMTKSTGRLLGSFSAIFGLGRKDFLDAAKTVTVEEFVQAITTARSRILHGTWPTLHSDLPQQPGRLTARFGDVEALTRRVLLEFSVYLDAYQAAGKPDDNTDAFVTWIKAERLAQAAPPTPP